MQWYKISRLCRTLQSLEISRKYVDHTVSDEVDEAGDEFDEVDDKELVPIETALILSLSLTLFALFFVTVDLI